MQATLSQQLQLESCIEKHCISELSCNLSDFYKYLQGTTSFVSRLFVDADVLLSNEGTILCMH